MNVAIAYYRIIIYNIHIKKLVLYIKQGGNLMLKRRMIGLVLSLAMVLSLFAGMTMVSAAPIDTELNDEGMVELTDYTPYKTFNFKSTSVDGAIDVSKDDLYDSTKGYGFVTTNNAMPTRKVDPTRIVQDENGCNITETSTTTSYINENNYNYGGIIFRVDLDSLGGYGLTVKTTSASDVTTVAPNGMQAGRLTGTSAWDSAGLVSRNSSAVWTDANTWKYDLVTGVPYIEIEVEPKTQAGGTVGIESFEVTKFSNNQKAPGDKPTVFVLGDSTQKTYAFDEFSMSGWGQIINKMFDLSQVNVINYSMGGRSMKSNYDEGRFNDVLYTAKEGDFVLMHSAHNDESTGNKDGAEARFGRGSNSTTYPKWLDIYCSVMKERGITPVLVTAMPRTRDGVAYSGFTPDSPKFMRDKASSDNSVELVELYNNSKAYLEKIGAYETLAIYQSLESGETPGKTNKGSYANGHPENKIDGTHYKEAAAKSWSKIIAEQIYNQGITNASSASEKMKELSGYLKDEVKSACVSSDWSVVYPERVKDVTEAKVNGYPEKNAYYRNQIEKVLELGVMSTDSSGLFNPDTMIKTNEFIEALCSIWNLETDSFSQYFTSGNLNRETMAGIVYDAYELKFGKNNNGAWNKPEYMDKYNNAAAITPDNPQYDPNATTNVVMYYPLVGWGNITDRGSISREYLEKFYEIYNLGLMRSEKGIERGKLQNGTELEPKVEVTRAKAAKELYFLFGLIQNIKTENQELTIPTSYGGTDKNAIVVKSVNYTAKNYEFSAVDIDRDGQLSVSLNYNQAGTPANKLVIEIYNADKSLAETNKYDVTGAGEVGGIDVTLTAGQYVTMYVVTSDSDETKLSDDRTAVCTEVIIPPKQYTVKTEAGIENGTVALKNNSVEQASLAALDQVELSADATVWWKATKSITTDMELMPGLTVQTNLDYTKGSNTIDGESFTGYVSSLVNGKFENGTITGSAFKFVAPSDGVLTAYTTNLGNTKRFLIIKEGATSESDNLVESMGIGGNISISAPVEKGQTYYTGVTGSKGRFVGISFTAGAPVVSVSAMNGEEIQIDTSPADGYKTESITAVDSNNKSIKLQSKSDDCATFIMPESNVTVNAKFVEGSKETPGPTGEPFVAAYEINEMYFKDENTITADYTCNDDSYKEAKMLIGTYSKADNGIMTNSKIFDINGTEVRDFEYAKPSDDSVVKAYIWSGTDTLIPLSLSTLVKNEESPITNQITLTQESSGTTEVYTTVNDALAKAVELNPTSEAERVVLSMMPGIYREQVDLDTPYITIRKDDSAQYHNVEASYGVGNPDTNQSGGYMPDSTKEVVISWYYGTGYMYKSVGSNGKYDKELAAAPGNTASGNSIDQWGPVLKLNSNAKNFIAEDIVIENSFNRYLTQEELDDCVTPESGKPARTANTDVTKEAANERAAAIVCKADLAEFRNCKMLGTQDTMGLNAGREYYKNCYIEGRTDYLCGDATVVFDECDLMFYGYSDTDKGSTLIAPQAPSNGKYGYLFYKCFIGSTKDMRACTLGRPWGDGAQATYYMCIIQDNNTIVTDGNAWGSMGSNDPKENANFIEFGSVYPDGTNAIPAKTSKNDRQDYVADEWEILEYNPRNYMRSNTVKYPGDWDPMDFAKNYIDVDAEIAIAETNVNTAIAQNSGNTIVLPAASSGFEYKWVSSSPNATVNGDSVELIRPASGMDPINAGIILYIRKTGTEFGDKVEVPLIITPTDDTTNVFTLSGTVTIPEVFDADVNYSVELTANGALVKTQNGTIPAGQTSGIYTAQNIPYGMFDVKIKVDNQELQIASPDRGTTTVTGSSDDANKVIDIVIGKLVSQSLKITADPSMTTSDSKLSFTNTDGTYDFKASGDTTNGYYWNLIDSISESERAAVASAKKIVVTYSLTQNATEKSQLREAYIDLKSGSSIPGAFKSSTDSSRFIRAKMNASWEQIDTIDGAIGGFSGSSNTDNQQLNLCGKVKYDSKSTSIIQNTLSFENSITSVLGTGENTNSGGNKDKEVSFVGFPSDINMSNLFLVVYPNKSGANFTISDLNLEYQVMEVAE